MKTFLLIISLMLSVVVGCYAQVNSFKDTTPIFQVDSLENWVGSHKQPTENRLQNLIILERTYTWTKMLKQGVYLNEIINLSNSLSNPHGKAAHAYLQGWYYYKLRQISSASTSIKKALTQFETLNDPSGKLHCYALLLLIQAAVVGDATSQNSLLQEEYIQGINRLLITQNDIYDYLQAQNAFLTLDYSKVVKKNSAKGNTTIVDNSLQPEGRSLEDKVNVVLAIIHKNPKHLYALMHFQRYLVIAYYVQNRMLDAYHLSKNIIESLDEDQSREKVVMSHNIANYCIALNRNNEAERYCKQGLSILDKYEKNEHTARNLLYGRLKEIAIKRKDYKNAFEYSEKSLTHYKKRVTEENTNKMLDIQAQYEFERKQKEILILEETQLRNTVLLSMAGLVIVIICFLGLRLYRSNQTLKAFTASREQLLSIIAHDLRRPMHAFHGISDLINFHLKRKEYTFIENFSKSLDESGVAIQKMLDNLLAWSLSQQQKLPHNPINFPLIKSVSSVVELYEKVGIVKEIMFEVHCPEALSTYADPNAIELIIRNLIDNSYKALPPKGKIQIKAQLINATHIQLQIADNGKGIPSHKLTIIQQAFRKPKKAVIGDNGLGMGIVMIAQFIDRNSGSISVESYENEGTIFTVLLPSSQ